jgi:hypothetical protein
MTRNISTTARRTITSTLAALVLAIALPQIGLAASSDAGLWKVNPAQAKFNSGSVTLTIERVQNVGSTAGRFIVISEGSVYVVTGAAASDSKGLKQVDYTRMTSDGRAVLIGTNVRSTDHCGFACQRGLPERHLTLTFKAVNGGEQQINDMLAADRQTP